MKDSKTDKDYHGRTKVVVNQMRSLGENIIDLRVVEKILVSLTRKYDSIVAAIEQSKDLTTMSVAKLIGFLKTHDKRLNSYEEDSIESAFQSKLNIRS
jgi:hypothetical protein